MNIPTPVYPAADESTTAAAYVAKKKAADTHAMVKNKTDDLADLAGNQIVASSLAIYGGTAAEAQAAADSLGHDAFAQVSFETVVQNFLRYKRGLAPVPVVPASKVLSVTSDGDSINYDALVIELDALFARFAPSDAVVSITDAPAP